MTTTSVAWLELTTRRRTIARGGCSRRARQQQIAFTDETPAQIRQTRCACDEKVVCPLDPSSRRERVVGRAAATAAGSLGTSCSASSGGYCLLLAYLSHAHGRQSQLALDCKQWKPFWPSTKVQPARYLFKQRRAHSEVSLCCRDGQWCVTGFGRRFLCRSLLMRWRATTTDDQHLSIFLIVYRRFARPFE